MLSNTNERSLPFHILKYKLSNTNERSNELLKNERTSELLKSKGHIEQNKLKVLWSDLF